MRTNKELALQALELFRVEPHPEVTCPQEIAYKFLYRYISETVTDSQGVNENENN